MDILDLIPILVKKQSNFKIHFAIGPDDKKEALKAFTNNKFKEWQEDQNKENFNRKSIISLVHYNNNEWLFVGVYEVISFNKNNGRHLYKTKLTNIGKELIGRLVIKFKKTFRQSYPNFENYSSKLELSEILKEKILSLDFPGYENVCIKFSELMVIIKNNSLGWNSALKSVKGVYLIVDNKTGKQYVGSAYNEDGIWERWAEYINTGHGNNVKLIQLLQNEGQDYTKHFVFSILEVYTKTISNDYILQREVIWKDKLHSRSFGYNTK